MNKSLLPLYLSSSLTFANVNVSIENEILSNSNNVNNILNIDYNKDVNDSFNVWIWINKNVDDLIFTTSMKLLSTSKQLWINIEIKNWSKLKKYLIQESIVFNDWKIKIWASLIKKIEEFYFNSVWKTINQEMVQKSLWIEYSKTIDHDIIKELNTSIIYYDVWDVKLWSIWDIVDHTDSYYDWTKVSWWIKLWKQLFLKAWVEYELLNSIKINSNFWLWYTKTNELLNSKNNNNFSLTTWTNLIYKYNNKQSYNLWVDYSDSSTDFILWFKYAFKNNFNAILEWKYIKNNTLDNKKLKFWIEYNFGESHKTNNNILNNFDLNPIEWLNDNEIQIKELVEYKKHLVYIDKTKLTWNSYIDTNEDWTLDAVYLDIWINNIKNISYINYSEHEKYFSVKDWNLIKITNFEELYAPITYNIVIKDTNWNNIIYEFKTAKWSVILDISTERKLEIPDNIAAAIVNWTLDRVFIEWLMSPIGTYWYINLTIIEKIIAWKISQEKLQQYKDWIIRWSYLDNIENLSWWSTIVAGPINFLPIDQNIPWLDNPVSEYYLTKEKYTINYWQVLSELLSQWHWTLTWAWYAIKHSAESIIELWEQLFINNPKQLGKDIWYFYHLNNFKTTGDSFSYEYVKKYEDNLKNQIKTSLQTMKNLPSTIEELPEQIKELERLSIILRDKDRAKWIYESDLYYKWLIWWYSAMLIWEMIISKKINLQDFRGTWIFPQLKVLNNKIEIEKSITNTTWEQIEIHKWWDYWLNPTYNTLTIEKFHNINSIEDIVSITNKNKVDVSIGHWTDLIPWNYNVAEWILQKLETKWWTNEMVVFNNKQHILYRSPDWIETVILEKLDLSPNSIKKHWYNVTASIKFQKDWVQIWEVWFITNKYDWNIHKKTRKFDFQNISKNINLINLRTKHKVKYNRLVSNINKKYNIKNSNHIISRIDLMDHTLQQKAINYPNEYIKSFENGKYPMLNKIQTKTNCDKCRIYSNYTNIKKWKLRDYRGFHFNSQTFDFIIQNWNIKIWRWHSYISNWENIDFAWELVFNSKWDISSISNKSWHYKPNIKDKDYLFNILKLNDIDISKIRINKMKHK